MPKPVQYNNQRANFEPARPGEATAQDPSPATLARHARLRRTVLDNIGIPDDLLDVSVRHLWGDCYRITVFRDVRKEDKTYQRTGTDSYFVQVVDDGIVATPPLDRKYFDDALAKITQDRP